MYLTIQHISLQRTIEIPTKNKTQPLHKKLHKATKNIKELKENKVSSQLQQIWTNKSIILPIK